MNFWQHPDLLDRLAAEYALGTMHGGARRRFEAVMQAHPAVAQAAARWAEKLQPLADTLPAPAAGDVPWQKIETRLFGFGRTVPPAMPWWKRLLGPAPAAALALGLVVGIGLPLVRAPDNGDGPQLPESYVGVLATEQGKPGLIVAGRRNGRTLDLKVLQPVKPTPGRTALLWLIDAQGRPQPLAALPTPDKAGFTSITLDQTSEQLFANAVELAVSFEAEGARPPAPTERFVYRGLCGKLWPPKPAAR